MPSKHKRKDNYEAAKRARAASKTFQRLCTMSRMWQRQIEKRERANG